MNLVQLLGFTARHKVFRVTDCESVVGATIQNFGEKNTSIEHLSDLGRFLTLEVHLNSREFPVD